MRVTVRRMQDDHAYVVKADLPLRDLNVARVFQWGMLDEGDVSWQRARADAHRYAAELRKSEQAMRQRP